MGRIQLGKILQENLVQNSCGKILRKILVGKSCGKILWKILWEMLWENLAGQGRGEKANLRKAVIGGNLAFGIGCWEPTNQDPAWENLAGKSCR